MGCTSAKAQATKIQQLSLDQLEERVTVKSLAIFRRGTVLLILSVNDVDTILDGITEKRLSACMKECLRETG